MDKLQGIFAASITPLNDDFSPDLEAIPEYLAFLAGRGCHGALILGTTGEGPSFSFQQRSQIFKASVIVQEEWPDFKLLAGTSTPSLDETVKLTQAAFDLGMDGAVVLPPYYYHKSGAGGLLAWYKNVIEKSVPRGGKIYAYHIPALTGVDLPIDLLQSLVDNYPGKFAGIKDSSGDQQFATLLGETFGDELSVFTGNDRLLTHALGHHAAGCITAIANLISPDLRVLWEANLSHESTEATQTKINLVRETCEQFQPFPPLIKFLVHHFFDFPRWPLCPPLEDLSPINAEKVSTLLILS